MSGARKTVIAEVRGRPYRLRISLMAMDRIEVACGGTPFNQVVGTMGSERTVRFGWVLSMFRAFAAAGGDTMSAKEAEALEPSDMPAISNGVAEVLEAYGLVELQGEGEGEGEGEDDEGNEEATGTEEETPSPPRGESGSE